MSGISKRVSGSWISGDYGIMKTATDTITTLPADIYANAATATVGLKGQTVQSGTPTPDNPVMPEGCGDLETSGAKAGQYKIPISSAGQTTSVYLGEVETTRKIGKIVLDGTIPLSTRSGEPTGIYFKSCADLGITPVAYEVVCSHFSKSNTNMVANMADNTILLSASTLYIRYTATNDINAWLASNPITVWYVLATPTTGIVNEPIRKIGDYADEVSNISIPVTAGGDTLSVGTTVQPSEVTVNYKGWHPKTPKESNNGSWT